MERLLYENTKKNRMIFFEDQPVMRLEKKGRHSWIGEALLHEHFLRDVLAGFLASLLAAFAAHFLDF